MTTLAPAVADRRYPDPERLRFAAGQNLCIPCHLCGHAAPDPDCIACLGFGWLRACLACSGSGAGSTAAGLLRVCLVCDGRRYTAGSAPSPGDEAPRTTVTHRARGSRPEWDSFA